ncbi:MAG: DNA polymerase III subunit gamma/tau, partial [Hominenteromicrobium sp.]
MYKALYRKYRPQVFSDVVGQPQVTVTLKNELMAGRISHAYLFTGSHGTGKTTCAKILAKAVNCLDLQDGDPCGVCPVCRGLDDGSILDVVEIDAASNNGVDSIRSLIEESNFTPTTAQYRVYIIDEVHMLSVAAFNALLKTLEEPPAHVIFILATTEVHKLLPTILSRCQRFDFRRIAPEDVAERLELVCEREGVEIDHDAATLIASTADGGMRDALSILDQCIGRSTGCITYALVAETAGLAGRGHLLELASCIHTGDRSGALEKIDALYKASKDMGRLCEELAGFFRNLMLIKTMKDATGIIKAVGEELEQM